MQKNIYRQAGLALLTVILTVVILFAMTSAWYTNIVQTSGLVFQAESWGFEGEINMMNPKPILASPGDSGLVCMEVKNSSQRISAVSVNVSKDAMEEEMQQRLFFYVDTPMIRNEEEMERVYINELESYTYTLFNSGKLSLTEKFHNGPQIKWQWVYDVLGYYVLAEPLNVRTYDGTEKQLLSIKEYLRPIEYNYDDATFKLQDNGNGTQTYVLATVDGVTTPQQFLKELSKKDGYSGDLELDKAWDSNCYPISVDDNGYGIYAYLCSYKEIEDATDYDTALGELAYQLEHRGKDSLTEDQQKKLSPSADLVISAQKNDAVVATVHTLPALQAAIAQNTTDVIQLTENITIPSDGESLEIPSDSKIMLDLNNYILQSQLEGAAIEVEPGGSLTVINGDMIGLSDKESTAINAYGAEVVMSGVKMTGFDYGLYLTDDLKSNVQDSYVYIVDSDLQSDVCSVFATGNGTLSHRPTQLVIENTKLYGKLYGIAGNGNSAGDGRWGTDIQLINSTVSSDPQDYSAGIYHPQQNSTLSLYNCEVSGYTGMAVKGGNIKLEDTKVYGRGSEPFEAKIVASGFQDTADAVYIETGYDYEILMEIRGTSELISSKGKSLQVFEPDNPYVVVKIYSGTFQEAQPEEYIASGSVQSGSTVMIDTTPKETTEAVQ